MSSIFVFDSDIPMQQLYKIIFGRYFKDDQVTASAEEDVIKTERQKPFDLLILEVMVRPGDSNIYFNGVDWHLTGYEFLKRLRAGAYEKYGFPANMPVVVASALAYDEEIERVKALGVQGYLEKPFRPKPDLIVLVNQVLKRE